MTTVETVRYAQPDELRTLEELQRRACLAVDAFRDQLLDHPDTFRVSVVAIRDQRVRVATGGGRVMGFATVMPVDDESSEFEALFVDPELIGSGVGEALVDDAVAIARDEGLARLEATAVPHAQEFYAKAGFAETGPVETRFGPAVRMARAL